MVGRGHLDAPLVGVARSDFTLDQFRARARESVLAHHKIDEEVLGKMLGRLRYVRGDYGAAATYEALRKELGEAVRPTYYLAIPPSLFRTVVERLARPKSAPGRAVVIEKPFGRDLASARALNQTLRAGFHESSVFRIDHYLGKESVQNML